MASEWRECTLGDALTLQRGFDLPVNKRVNGHVPVIASTGQIGWHNTTPLRGPGVVIGRSGSLGGGQFIEGTYWPLNTTLWVKDFKGNDPRYCYYLLKSIDFQQFNVGSGVPTLNRNHIHPLPIGLPSVEVQQGISRLLGSLDARIESLCQTNTTLEAIAKALFKSWFVDFDPVRAKAEGREPEGMDAATAALFPTEFEDTDFGRVPRGWSTRSVYDLGEFINGAAYKAFQPNSEQRGLPIIKIAELKAGITKQTGHSDVLMPEKYHLDVGDILFSWSGNPDTSIDTFVWSNGPALLNQHIFNVVPKMSDERSLVLVTLKYLRPQFAEIARNKQTTGLGHVTVGDLKQMRVTSAPVEVVKSWDTLIGPLVARALLNQQKLQLLGNLRDTLLPRLISGKLRLPEAEREAEDALA